MRRRKDESVRVRKGTAEPRLVSLDDIEESGVVRQAHDRDHSVSAQLSGGDVDARWDQAESAGEETAGGSVATPDQDIVEEIGKAIGVTYEDDEPLRVGGKELERDEHRWELDPASAEDFGSRASEAARRGRAPRGFRRRS